jgi:hypothetical protein
MVVLPRVNVLVPVSVRAPGFTILKSKGFGPSGTNVPDHCMLRVASGSPVIRKAIVWLTVNVTRAGLAATCTVPVRPRLIVQTGSWSSR